MKTIIAYILICVFSLSGVYGQVIEEKEKELFKKYGVSERIKYDYKYTDGKIASKGLKASVYKYNKQGLVLEITSYNADGDVSRLEKFGYDNYGNRTMYERKGMRGDYKKDTEYEGDRIVQESGNDGSSAFKTVYKYNSNNRVEEIEYYTDNLFEVEEKRVYTYNGSKATVKVLHKGTTLKSTVKLVYNAQNQIVEETVLSLEGVELEKRLIKYNTNGSLMQEEKYRGGKKAYTYYYVYNANGELTKLVEHVPSKEKFDKKLYSYDSEGRIIEYKWARKAGQEHNSKKYTYGSNGVCIEEHTLYPATNYQIKAKYTYSFF